MHSTGNSDPLCNAQHWQLGAMCTCTSSSLYSKYAQKHVRACSLVTMAMQGTVYNIHMCGVREYVRGCLDSEEHADLMGCHVVSMPPMGCHVVSMPPSLFPLPV